MSNKFRIGVVGCGDITSDIVAGSRLNMKIEIPACADICEEKARNLAKKKRINMCFSDYGDMLDKTDMDAVYIAVPHHLHFPMTKMALDHGLHVLCEKPVTINIDEAFELCRLSKENGLKLGVNYQYRYDSGCYALARAAQNKELGDLYYGKLHLP